MQKWTKVVKYSVLPVVGGVPLVAVVACSEGGYAGRYDTENDGVIRILTSFSETGTQYKALENMVNNFNDQDDSNFKVEITQVQGGYDQIPQDLAKNFEAGEKTKLPNLVIGYPDHLGTVAKYDMELAFDDTYDDLFSDDFMAINDNIGGLEADSGTYLYPLGKSIDMLSVNQPVLGYILEVAKGKGLIANSKDSDIDQIDVIINAYKYSGDVVSSIWEEDSTYKYAGSEKFDDSIFTDGSKLLDFVVEANKMFEDNKETYILGIDSPTNFIYAMAFSELNASAEEGDDYYENFLFHIGEDGYVEYEFLDDKSSEQYKVFEDIYQKLEEALNEHAVYINTGGTYSSDLEKQHQIGLAIGSTAGYSYNYTPDDGTFSFKLGGTTFVGPSYTYLLEESEDSDKVGEFVNDDYTNVVYSYNYSNFDVEGDNYYDLKISSQEDQNTVDKWLEDSTSRVFVSSDEDVINAASEENLVLPEQFIPEDSDNYYPKYLVQVSEYEKVGSSESLQEEELLVLNAPQTFNSSFATSLIQGPSIFAVHNNTEEDEFLQTFLEWGFATSADTGKSPFEEFALAAGYVFPSKNILESDEEGPEDLLKIGDKDPNPAQILTFNTLEDISSNANHHAFENPADDTTSNTRDVLDAVISASFTNVDNGEVALTTEQIYENILKLI